MRKVLHSLLYNRSISAFLGLSFTITILHGRENRHSIVVRYLSEVTELALNQYRRPALYYHSRPITAVSAKSTRLYTSIVLPELVNVYHLNSHMSHSRAYRLLPPYQEHLISEVLYLDYPIRSSVGCNR